ncbi:hypothetical protein ABZ617_18035 [Nocardiopsis alba]|uniref:hypothetical protein n=1 Tax=Nocardiopsis alba TaxID=53437 RepID=UPI0033DB532C
MIPTQVRRTLPTTTTFTPPKTSTTSTPVQRGRHALPPRRGTYAPTARTGTLTRPKTTDTTTDPVIPKVRKRWFGLRRRFAHWAGLFLTSGEPERPAPPKPPVSLPRRTPRPPSGPPAPASRSVEQNAAAELSALRLLGRLSVQQRLARVDHRLSLARLLVDGILDERSRVERQLREAEQAEQDAGTQELGVAVKRYLAMGGRTWTTS